MRLIDLFEARRNPEQNPKDSAYDVVRKHAAGRPRSIFVSLTQLDKLGINPKSQYDTPLGIYAYPAEFVVETANEDMDDLPFAGESPYVNIFEAPGVANESVINLASMTSGELDQWTDRIRQVARDVFAKSNASKDWGWSPEAMARTINSTIETAQTTAKFSRPGGIFWSMTLRIAQLFVDLGTLETKKAPVAWNKLFRLLGIDGCVDYNYETQRGVGIIHTNEPSQAVFFSIQAIGQVWRTDNKWSNLSMRLGRDIGQDKKNILQVAQTLQQNGFEEQFREAIANGTATQFEKQVCDEANKMLPSLYYHGTAFFKIVSHMKGLRPDTIALLLFRTQMVWAYSQHVPQPPKSWRTPAVASALLNINRNDSTYVLLVKLGMMSADILMQAVNDDTVPSGLIPMSEVERMRFYRKVIGTGMPPVFLKHVELSHEMSLAMLLSSDMDQIKVLASHRNLSKGSNDNRHQALAVAVSLAQVDPNRASAFVSKFPDVKINANLADQIGRLYNIPALTKAVP